MLVEVSNTLEKGVLIKSEDGFKIVPLDELLKEVKSELTKINGLVEKLQANTQLLIESDLINVVKKYTEKFDNDCIKENLIIYMAYQLLNNDVNINGVDFPQDYEEIKSFIANPNGLVPIPNGLVPYFEMVKKDYSMDEELKEVK